MNAQKNLQILMHIQQKISLYFFQDILQLFLSLEYSKYISLHNQQQSSRLLGFDFIYTEHSFFFSWICINNNQFKQPVTRDPVMQQQQQQQQLPRLTKDNTLIKFKSSDKLRADSSISSMSSDTKNGVIYKLNSRGQAILPLDDFLIYRNGPELAEINMKPLLPYYDCDHRLHTKTYNTVNPTQENPQIQLFITFHHFADLSNGVTIKLTFIDAELIRDTDIITKMDPYLRLKVNDSDKWKSKTAKSAGKFPNFNREFINIQLKSFKDSITIEVWDEDLTRDDFIGQVLLKGYQLMGRGSEIIEEQVCYTKKQKVIPAGKIRFLAQTINLK